MKSTTHINYTEIQVSCRCGNTFTTRSVLGKPLRIEICSHCHPVYTGKQSGMESGQRVQQFQRKYGL